MGNNDTSDSSVDKTTQQESITPPEKRNPTGKGGFGDNPQNRNPGGWKKENTISYQYNRFMNMTPDELRDWKQTPTSERTVAMDLAYNRVVAAQKSLPDIKEITDRTEGKPAQYVEQTVSNNALAEVSDEELNGRIERYIKDRAK